MNGQVLGSRTGFPHAWAQARPRKSTVTRAGVVSAVVLAFVVFGVWALRLNGPIDLRYDAGVYYLLGTSLAQGNGYRITSEPGLPEAIQYPPLLPVLIAAHQKVLGTSDPEIVGTWLRRTYSVLFIGYALAALAVARAFLPPWPALLATVLAVWQANVILYSDMLFTELPFALVTLVFVWVMGSARFEAGGRWREILAFLLATTSFLLRSAGIALFAAWIGEAVLQRRWKQVVSRTLLALVPFGAWQIYITRVQSGYEYQHPAYAYQRASYQFYNVTYAENMALRNPFQPELGRAVANDRLDRVKAALAVLPVGAGEAVSEAHGFWRSALGGIQETPTQIKSWAGDLNRFPLYVLAALILAGVGTLIRRRAWGLVLTLFALLALLCMTPWPDQFARYLTPLTPLLCVSVVLGAVILYAYLGRCRPGRIVKFGRWAILGFGGVVVFVQCFATYSLFVQRHYEPATFVPGRGIDTPRLFYYDWSWVNWKKAVLSIKVHASPNDVVITTSPHLLYLETGMQAVFPPMESNPDGARHLIEGVPATWVIVDELKFMDISRRYALPAVLNDPGHWKQVYRAGGTRVFRHTAGDQAASSDTRSDLSFTTIEP